MTTETLTRNVTLKILECIRCGCSFAIPQQMHDQCFKYGGYWHCPNGHSQGWVEGEKEREEKDLRRQLTREAQRREHLETELAHTQRQVSAQKGAVTRLKNRAQHGVCPCCNRTFKQLAAHMANKHPDYAKGED